MPTVSSFFPGKKFRSPEVGPDDPPLRRGWRVARLPTPLWRAEAGSKMAFVRVKKRPFWRYAYLGSRPVNLSPIGAEGGEPTAGRKVYTGEYA